MIDDDDDFEIINGKRVLKDGRALRTPVSFMDAEMKEMLRQKYRGHRPGFVTDDDTDAHDAAEESRDQYVTWLGGAHKTPVVDADDDKPYRPTSLADAKAAAAEAYREYCEYLTDAHKQGRQP